jgi:asparagine synthase (glutamine-hydrolysing)
MEVIPSLPIMWDEPFSDSSQIPTFLVSKLARQHVTVSLSGDGGDELFAGYNRHIVGPAVWEKARRFPLQLRRAMGLGIGFLARHDLESLRRYLPPRMAVPNLSDRLDKLAGALKAPNRQAFYKDLASHWKDPGSLVLGGAEPATLLDILEAMPQLPGLREEMMYLDQMTYLPDDILTKVDRASMAVSLEARVPLLDHRVVEFAWRVPTKYKYRDGQGKWLLRQVLYKYVPNKVSACPLSIGCKGLCANGRRSCWTKSA